MSTVADKFARLPSQFNRDALASLLDFVRMFSNPEDEEDEQQYAALSELYTHWAGVIGEDGSTDKLYTQFKNTLSPQHDQLVARDQSILHSDSADLIGSLYAIPDRTNEVNTAVLYDLLYAPDDEDIEDVPEDERDSKGNFWATVTSLYSNATLLSSYNGLPLVKDILDMLLGGMDIAKGGGNVVEKVMDMCMNEDSFLDKIQALAEEEDMFEEIMTSIHRVVETLDSSGRMQEMIKKQMDVARDALRVDMLALAEELKIELTNEQADSVIEAIGRDDDDCDVISQADYEKIKAEYDERGMGEVDMGSMVSNLGSTMKNMISMGQSGDEDGMKKMLDETCGNLNIDSSAFIERMQSRANKQ